MFVPYPQSKLVGHPRLEDSADVRIAAFVKPVEGAPQSLYPLVKAGDFVVIGYSDDRGVDRNGGRPGAAEAPDQIRQMLYRMTPAPRFTGQLKIWDLGNLRSWGLPLLEAQEEARKIIRELRTKGARIVSLGGGNDWAYSDFADFFSQETEASKSRHLISVDAHLDMRPQPEDPNKAGHSGTPFRRILTAPLSPPSHMSVIGLQECCNAAAHLKWAQGFRVSTMFLEELPLSLDEQWKLLNEKLELQQKNRHYGLSIDMDAFAQAFAPGTSAPLSLGLEPRLIQHLIRQLAGKVSQVGVYETNPNFDQDQATSRLAARLVFEFLMSS